MKRLYIPILAGLAGAALLGLLIYGVTTQSASRTLDDAVASGARPLAPDSARALAVLAGNQPDSGNATRAPAATVRPPASSQRPPASSQRPPAASPRSLASYRGKVVVLNFWASWCGPCKSEAPLLERTQQQLERHNGTVLGVTYLDASPDSQDFVRRYHISYPNLRDTTGDFTHSYGTDQLPESFVIDRHGRITAISRGQLQARFLSRAIALAESS
ncbi:MAG TPA: redoxin domain-containing protein [Solirubrobacteraceae bacterium]|nr:redoxin domain-containing protein [Solirubrobacteraceae bacterium]